ncbi:cyclopropane fatty acyl phospholipid synthase [Solitalea koreensis]|uniref:Cyclopropane-fatty-acyl-phospholipid synthase n=1 Tax=Solitalea koreensis TaxID=543615 RepID=A0A521DEG0_9SPHI|nr:cyclopropane fatty acyl phospholipid synthase [Solitalea koreensis]SMO69978.1 cyclopropane-fatty-acyl-phospholipid synthase [Solitalea koreensis]
MKEIIISPPKASYYEERVKKLFAIAGITVNGSKDCDIQVNDQRFYKRVLVSSSLGLGESYMDGWWDCYSLDEFFSKVLEYRLDQYTHADISSWFAVLQSKILNFQGLKKAYRNASFHYDLGNDLFRKMLDKRLTYTCGYWKQASTLDEAQEAKLELTCQKLHLKPGMRILDIGCGWGSFAKYAAEKFDVIVTGINVSKEQLALGKVLCRDLPVELKFQDYREIEDQFDRVVSLGMFEHVGLKNYKTYFKAVNSRLKSDGIFLLHTIGSDVSTKENDPWISKYIFPNSLIPSIAQITDAADGQFIMEDLHNFGLDYDKTLMAWSENFSKNWPSLEKKYGERFYKMWQYYLLSCAGSFRARKNQLWQIVFTKGLKQGYMAIR